MCIYNHTHWYCIRLSQTTVPISHDLYCPFRSRFSLQPGWHLHVGLSRRCCGRGGATVRRTVHPLVHLASWPNSIFSSHTEGIKPQKARKKSGFHPKTSTHEGFSVPCVPKQHVRCLKMGTKWGMGHFFRPCLRKKRMDHQMFWFQILRQLHCDEQTLGIKLQNVPSIQKNRWVAELLHDFFLGNPQELMIGFNMIQ